MTAPAPSNTEFIKRLREITLTNISDENFGVNELSKATELTYYNLNRRLRLIIKKTTSQFINEIRLERAKEILEQEEITASEVAYRVGFGSPAYFSRCFHEHFGYPPGEIKKRGLNDQIENHNELPVTSKTEEDTPLNLKEQQPVHKKLSRKGFVLLSAGMLILAIASFLYFSPLSNNSAPRLNSKNKSIAVLPFKDLSNDTTHQYIAEGIMVDILNRLYEIREFRVISRTSVEQYRESKKSIPKIAKTLGVNFILEGSVLQYKNKVRVTVQLIDASHDQCILTEQYDRDFEDIFIIQSAIAKLVAEKLQALLTTKEKETIEKIPTQNKEAYKLYLMGRFIYKERIEEGSVLFEELLKSVEYYTQSILLDPDFALAYAGLAESYYHLAYWGVIPRINGFSMAKKNAFRALELDKELEEAHTVLGLLYTFSEWKWEYARKEFVVAIELNPNYPFAHANYSELLDILGEDDEARKEINLALKLDPTIYYFYRLSSNYYFNVGKLDEALEDLNRMQIFTTANQIYALWQKFYIYDRLKDDLHALESLKEEMAIDSSVIKYLDIVDPVYQKSGMNGIYSKMAEILQQDTPPPSLSVAQLYARLGMKHEAVAWLRKAFDEKYVRLPYLNNDARCARIRRDPGFREIIDKLGLSPYFNPEKDFSPVAE